MNMNNMMTSLLFKIIKKKTIKLTFEQVTIILLLKFKYMTASVW